MASITSERVFRLTAYLFLASIPFDIPNRPIPVDVPTITAAMMLFAAIYDRGSSWALPGGLWLFAAWLYIGVLATLYGGAHHPLESSALILQILEPMLVLATIYNAGRDSRTLRMMLWAIAAGCVIRAALQVAGFGTTSLGRWETEERLTAWGENPNNASANLAIGLLILIGLGFAGRRRWPVRILLAGASISICFAMVQMGSRGAIVGLIAGLLAMSMVPTGTWNPRSFAIRLLFTLGVAGGVIALCYSSPSTRGRFEETLEEGQMSGREELYPTLYGMFLERPILGWGLVDSQYELGRRTQHPKLSFARRDSHDLYLEVATSTGVCGMLPFFLGLALCFWSAWRGRLGVDGALPFALFTCVLVVNVTQDWLLSKLCWVVLGYGLASGAHVEWSDRLRRLSIQECARLRASQIYLHESL